MKKSYTSFPLTDKETSNMVQKTQCGARDRETLHNRALSAMCEVSQTASTW